MGPREIKVRLSPDELQAFLSVKASPEDFPTKEDLRRFVRKKGVTHGILEETLAEVADKRESCENVTIARGKPPVSGKPPRIIWYIDISPGKRPFISETGRADFKKLIQCTKVNKDQALVSLVPGRKGEPGLTVTGKVIASEPIPEVKLPQGKNTYTSPDGLTLYAAQDGMAFMDGDSLHVDTVFHVKGDVDFRTGNIKFDGTVIIEGDVRSGFRVEATGPIFVNGNVEAAEVYSQNSDIVVQLGIVGKGRAKVLAGGSLICGFIQDATVAVRRDVLVKRYVINSMLSAGGKVLLNKGEGLIRGGRVHGDKGIGAIYVGSPQGTPTEIGVSGDEQQTFDRERWELMEKIEQKETSLAIIEKRLQFLSLLRERLDELSQEKIRELNTLRKDRETLKAEIAVMRERLEQLIAPANGMRQSHEILIWDTLQKGVVISIGRYRYYTDKQFKSVRIYRRGEEIVIEPIPTSKRSEQNHGG